MTCGNSTVLYAEDDPDDVWMVKRMVQKAQLPIDLRIVQDGEEAICWLDGRDQFANREQFPLPALLITDLKMPRVDGYQLLNWVRNHPKLSSLPVIIRTTSNLETDSSRCHALGATDFVVKHPLADKLIELLAARFPRVEAPVR